MTLIKRYDLVTIKQILFIALFAFPVLPLKLSNLLFICFSIVVLIIYYKEKSKFEFKVFGYYLLFSLPFIPYFMELILYSDNKIIQFEAEKKMLFMFAPVVFYLNSTLVSKVDIKKALNCFIVAVSILSFLVVVYLLLTLIVFSEDSYQNGAYILRKVFEDISGLHPVYYGLFSTIVSLWIIYDFNSYQKKYKWLIGFSLGIMLFLNFILAAKMPLLILVLGIMWIGYKKVLNKKKLLFIYLVILASLLCISVLLPSLRNRLLETIEYFENPKINNTILERYVIFETSKFMFFENFFTGVGARNTQDALDYGYYWARFGKGFENHFNSHNQYLTLGLSYGMGGLSLFVGLLVILFKKVKNNPLGFIFWCCSVLIMFTESILERQMGIYYFLFFGLLFLLPFQSVNTTNANSAKAK